MTTTGPSSDDMNTWKVEALDKMSATSEPRRGETWSAESCTTVVYGAEGADKTMARRRALEQVLCVWRPTITGPSRENAMAHDPEETLGLKTSSCVGRGPTM